MPITKLLTTKEVAYISGLSTSFFEKGRTYGYGPAFVRIRGGIRYRHEDLEAWLFERREVPGGLDHV